MPELPEVAAALRRIRPALLARRIRRVEPRHPAFAAALPAGHRRRVAGRRIVRLERRGKYQLLHLDDGSTLLVHFRMTGDWRALPPAMPLPPHTRLVIHTDADTRVAFVDPRALGTVTYHASDAPPQLALGPEPLARGFTPAVLAAALATTRSAIKPALLDQRIVAGLGNIYAAEACWHAALAPQRVASALPPESITALVAAIKQVLRQAPAQRYQDQQGHDLWQVYDREGLPCTRCGTRVARVTQSGRSTYWCPGCQR